MVDIGMIKADTTMDQHKRLLSSNIVPGWKNLLTFSPSEKQYASINHRGDVVLDMRKIHEAKWFFKVMSVLLEYSPPRLTEHYLRQNQYEYTISIFSIYNFRIYHILYSFFLPSVADTVALTCSWLCQWVIALSSAFPLLGHSGRNCSVEIDVLHGCKTPLGNLHAYIEMVGIIIVQW